VGKIQSDQKEGLAIQQSLQGHEIEKQTELRSQSVNEARDTGEGAEQVKNNDVAGGEREEGEKKKRRDQGEEETLEIIKDPALGKLIDFSG
jgi:hypothetical protein